jgi:hypothetical protein
MGKRTHNGSDAFDWRENVVHQVLRQDGLKK